MPVRTTTTIPMGMIKHRVNPGRNFAATANSAPLVKHARSYLLQNIALDYVPQPLVQASSVGKRAAGLLLAGLGGGSIEPDPDLMYLALKSLTPDMPADCLSALRTFARALQHALVGEQS